MISEFQQLAGKVDQLASLTLTLRAENADLRRQIADLSAVNLDLSARIQQAHDRVAIVLEALPSVEQEST